MREHIIDILKVVAPLSVALIVFAQALGIAPLQVAAFFRDRPVVMLRSLLAALVIVPAAALALILLFHASPPLAMGLAILVSCPPAPLMLKAAPKMGGGNAAFMASLHLCLAMLAVVTVPLTLRLISLPLSFATSVDLPALLWIVARTILIPIGVGLAVRAAFPAFADRFGGWLEKAGSAGLLIVILFALAAFYPALLTMDLPSYGVVGAVSIAALAIGHLLGPANQGEKTILAVECGVRHPALAIMIGTTNFSAQQALPVLVPSILTFIAIAMAYLFLRGHTLNA